MTYKVYLAGRFDRQHEFRRYRDELVDVGIEVTADWLDNHGDAERIASGQEHYSDLELGDFAASDLHDVRKADLLVAFTESPDIGSSSGGRHIETGFALALDMPIIVVGPRENVFHKMTIEHHGRDIEVCDLWSDAFLAVVRRAIANRKIEQPIVLRGMTKIVHEFDAGSESIGLPRSDALRSERV